MSHPSNLVALRNNIFKQITTYSHKVAQLGQRVRRKVFGFRRRSTAHTDCRALPVKVLYQHRIVQRQRVFQQNGGARSGIARHALEKVRHNQQP